jgi:hypothetical protein
LSTNSCMLLILLADNLDWSSIKMMQIRSVSSCYLAPYEGTIFLNKQR